MIPLRFKVETDAEYPFVVRLNADGRALPFHGWSVHDAALEDTSGNRLTFRCAFGDIAILHASADDVDGDVLFVVPERSMAHRLIRAKSPHNTLLVTEQCDQLCVMCSQPPKRHHSDMFPYFETAALMAPEGATLGISGGEPLLHKAKLLPFMARVLAERPDLKFHVLTNGQHFEEPDLDVLAELPRDAVLWGIPLYSTVAADHDRLVAKTGAFDRLMVSLEMLCRGGAAVELRTVVMSENVDDLPSLAHLISRQLPFISHWAIMQLESIGYGRMNWDRLFHDNSLRFGPIGRGIDIVRSRGIEAALYNFPLCTVPAAYRAFAPSTISDWKRRYLDTCGGCEARSSCGGFFEWYPDDRGFERVGLA